jgi:hypothetical protein
MAGGPSVTVLTDEIVAPSAMGGPLGSGDGVEAVITVTGCGILRMRRRRLVAMELGVGVAAGLGEEGDCVEAADAVLDTQRTESACDGGRRAWPLWRVRRAGPCTE